VVGLLRPITYNLKTPPLVADDPEPAPELVTPPPTQLGLLAEEVDQVVPDAVTYDEQGPMSIDLGAMVAVLVGAVQELTARVAALEGTPA
jgi:hypothetical protein